MTPFVKNRPPPIWATWETRWRKTCRTLPKRNWTTKQWDKISAWRHQGETLTVWFHRTVRVPQHAALLCAYCDGELALTSKDTIDHFVPRALCVRSGRRHLHLFVSWNNLFPGCSFCNGTKLDQWSPLLIRPDDPRASDYFRLDAATGDLIPKLSLNGRDKARAVETIRVFGLNLGARPQARLALIERMADAVGSNNLDRLRKLRSSGPYRFVVEWFIKANGIAL